MSSIALTNSYRTRLLSLERRVATQARAAWPTIETFDDTNWPQHIGTVVTRAQTESVRATAGYTSALLRSNRKPGRVALDTSRYAGVSRDGRPIAEALESALIGVTAALKDGREPAVALSIGLSRGLRMAQFETIQAGRDALLDATDEDDRFTGWRRNVAGTCAACMAISGVSGPHFEVHPSCQCVPQPTIPATAQVKNAAAPHRVPDDLAEKNIYQWTPEDKIRAHGFEMTDYGDAVGGGYNYKFVAKDKSGTIMGRFEVNSSGREGTIGIVEVEEAFRRQGVATRMLDYFRRYEPDMKLDWGYLTEDGAALRASMPKEWQ